MRLRAFAVVAVLAVCAAPAYAQAVKLEFNNGRVSLNAQNAPLRTILAEWARLGGATIVNGDRVTGAPVTLELIGVPERQALDTLLRGVAAYMLAPRRDGSIGTSTFDRILILPTSAAPRNPPPPANAGLQGPGAPGSRPLLPRPPVLANPGNPGGGDDQDGIPADLVPQPRVIQPPRPIGPGIVPDPDEDVADADQTEPVIVGGQAPTPGNPFGVPAGSSARPGVIAPAPQPAQPQTGRPRQQP